MEISSYLKEHCKAHYKNVNTRVEVHYKDGSRVNGYIHTISEGSLFFVSLLRRSRSKDESPVHYINFRNASRIEFAPATGNKIVFP